jgi:CheY-like chemotaxis protein
MSKETILVIEDETIVGMELKDDLERLGYQVPEIVANGEDVVQAVARHHPDLLLMDVRIAGSVDGIEAAFQAKAEFDIPVIYLSAYSDPDTLRRAALTMPEAYLLKPFDEKELAANVELALAKTRSGASIKRELRHAIPLVDVLDGAAILMDVDDKIVHANRAAASMLKAHGLSPTRGAEISRLLEPAPGDEGRKLFRLRAKDEGQALPRARVDRLTRSDGRVFGSLAVFASMDRRERTLLEESAVEANRALARMLPAPDSLGRGYRVGGFLLPCRSGCGDLVGIFEADERHAVFFGLDVMGHGILASLAARSLRSAMQRLIRSGKGAGGPVAAIRELDREVRANADDWGGAFVTLAFGTLERATGAFRFARAGHAPLLHASASGEVRTYRTAGTALGHASSALLEEGCGVLEPGDRLFVPSDGVLGSFGASDIGAAVDALTAFVSSRSRARLEDVVEELRDLASVERSDARVDDSSLLAIEREVR